MNFRRLKQIASVVGIALLGVLAVPGAEAHLSSGPTDAIRADGSIALAPTSSNLFLPYVLKQFIPIPSPTPAPTPPPSSCPVTSTSAEWSTIAGNSQRTSSTPEEVGCNLKVIWYRPIEAYIPQNSQVITANGVVYISSAKGLYALDSNTGDVRWRFDTEIPLGDSPTVYNGVVYVGSMDKRLFAINANTGAKIWSFDGAGAGFSANPLVLVVDGKPVVFIGNRDGNFYAIQDNGSAPSLLWSFSTGGPIDISAASSKDNTKIYFASNDNYAYALSTATGTKVWQSARLPGEGFDSYWPVVYTDRFTGKDYVVFSGAVEYRQGPPPAVGILNSPPYNFPGWGSWSDVQTGILSTAYGFTGPLPAKAPSNSWEQGKTIVDGTPLVNWLENYPDPAAQDGNRGKPWQRTTFVLDAANGTEAAFDANHNGKVDYAPFAFWGTRSGNHYPPVISPDNVLYTGNITNNCCAAGNAVTGWETGTPYFSVLDNILGAVDEPQALSFGGNSLYRSICCDRWANWHNISSNDTGQVWPYNGSTSSMPGYDIMWYIDPTTFPRWEGWYTGKCSISPCNTVSPGRSGVYHNHGDQNPIVPYQGKLFLHRSNAVIAFGPPTATVYGNKGLLPINVVADASIPTPARSSLQAKLTGEIQKMINAGNLRSGYYNDGQGAGSMNELTSYFENPGDTLLALTMAYPNVSAAVQPALLTYIKQEFASYFNPTLYHSRGWTGAPREAFAVPIEIQNYMNTMPPRTDQNYSTNAGTSYSQGKIYTPINLYAMWKYAQLVPADTLITYNLAKGALNIGGTTDAELTAFPWELNSYIGGYIGFLNLQSLAGKATTDGTLRTQVTNELNRLENLRATNLSVYLSNTATVNTCPVFYSSGGNLDIHCRDMNIGREFVNMTPELGTYLNQNALAASQSALAELTYEAPYWFQEGYTSTHLEGVKQPLYDVSLLLGKAYMLKQSYSEVSKYLDSPAFVVGDLIYIQNLVATLSAP